jgi:hypothetical protein
MVMLRLSIEPAISPKACKDFQKEEMVSIKMIFLSTSPGVISGKVGVFRKNGDLFDILDEYSKKVKLIQKRNSSQKTTFMQSRWEFADILRIIQ